MVVVPPFAHFTLWKMPLKMFVQYRNYHSHFSILFVLCTFIWSYSLFVFSRFPCSTQYKTWTINDNLLSKWCDMAEVVWRPFFPLLLIFSKKIKKQISSFPFVLHTLTNRTFITVNLTQTNVTKSFAHFERKCRMSNGFGIRWKISSIFIAYFYHYIVMENNRRSLSHILPFVYTGLTFANARVNILKIECFINGTTNVDCHNTDGVETTNIHICVLHTYCIMRCDMLRWDRIQELK